MEQLFRLEQSLEIIGQSFDLEPSIGIWTGASIRTLFGNNRVVGTIIGTIKSAQGQNKCWSNHPRVGTMGRDS